MSGFVHDGDGKIQILPPHVARKIAAGEVIERPQSVLRELLDNAIDAGAKEISVWLKNGGIDEILVSDDGCGMGFEDLQACCLPHATSKIRTEQDLLAIQSLGFRGEALAAISAVSKIEIISSFQGNGNKISLDAGTSIYVGPSAASRGTRISVQSLFYNLPARRHFMKRGSSEFSLCQTTFLEKALCFPEIRFKLFSDGELRWNLPEITTDEKWLTRLWAIHGKDLGDRGFLFEQGSTCEGASIRLALLSPDVYRHDRRLLHVYINGRRISDYGLMQALEYGYTGYIPGGRFPLAFVWLTVDPSLMDVNIHPAKREVKLHNHSAIHHTIVSTIQKFLRQKAIQPRVQPLSLTVQHGLSFQPTASIQSRDPLVPQFSNHKGPASTLGSSETPTLHDESIGALPRVSEAYQVKTIAPSIAEGGLPQYLGKVFGCFLLFVLHDELYMLDMHAAHERILFNDFIAAPKLQNLLVPQELDISEHGDLWLQRELKGLEQLSFRFTKENGKWIVHGTPVWLGDDLGFINKFLDNPHGQAQEILREVAAQAACRKAIKDGDFIDRHGAEELIDQALKLPDPRCPHGRPIWYILSKEDLFTLIGRHV